ncbi:MAG: hypothetical protein SFU99_23525 [Saprospiraceae bacterium]|nr:hypothetical protein [Saprospiraceae bacterium]
MKLFITLLLLMVLPFCLLCAQTEKEKVEAAVRNYVEAFYDADTNKIH